MHPSSSNLFTLNQPEAHLNFIPNHEKNLKLKGKNPQVYRELTIFHLEGDKRHKQRFEDCAYVLLSYPSNGQCNHFHNPGQVQAHYKLIATFS
ncbi:hypothetical protein [Nostoc sp. UHCC 0870]|uniref:hypothetical protein n=1 Tax=Nostoc sp. UHCC 0870 TaxID=2914041 RepID=UPI001EDCEF6A|nr:hypothetical protein [Nostoc sp. UHCC 0870]